MPRIVNAVTETDELQTVTDAANELRRLGVAWNDLPRGWAEVVLQLVLALSAVHSDLRPLRMGSDYGELRSRVAPEGHPLTRSPGVVQALLAAEIRSGSTCELCGRPGERDFSQRWVTTRCPQHPADGTRP